MRIPTVRTKLAKLADHGLAERIETEWRQRGDKEHLDHIAIELGMADRGRRQRERHAEERREHHEELRRRAQLKEARK